MATEGNRKNKGKGSNSATRPYGHLFGESTSKSGLDADWNAVDPTVLSRIIWSIDTMGGSVTIGSNKKGTAYYFKVYLGAPYDPMYFDGDEAGRAEMSEWAERLVEEAANTV